MIPEWVDVPASEASAYESGTYYGDSCASGACGLSGSGGPLRAVGSFALRAPGRVADWVGEIRMNAADRRMGRIERRMNRRAGRR